MYPVIPVSWNLNTVQTKAKRLWRLDVSELSTSADLAHTFSPFFVPLIENMSRGAELGYRVAERLPV